MIDGFNRAVGPIQPAEQLTGQTDSLYRCPTGYELNAAGDARMADCSWWLHDAGTGRTVGQCTVHGVAILAIDWSAAEFGGGPPLDETLHSMRTMFLQLGNNEDEVNVLSVGVVQRFSDLFSAIANNLQKVVERERAQHAADAARTDNG